MAQSGSLWTDQIVATALLHAPGLEMAALPGGTLRLEKGETLAVRGSGGPLQVTRYDLTGVQLTPETMLIDGAGRVFAVVDPTSVVVRQGYEGEEKRLRKLAADWATARFVAMEAAVAHRWPDPVRIRNVRLFDPHASALTAPVSVVVRGCEIAAVEAAEDPAAPGEVTIDGAGGVLVPGFYKMHAHLQNCGSPPPQPARRAT